MKFIAIAYLGTALSTLGLTAQDAPQGQSLEMPSYQEPATDWASHGDAVESVKPGDGTYGATWADVEETNRHILIMSSIDGFAAAGDSGPCFKGSTNATIDETLMDSAFSGQDPTGLPGALSGLANASTECEDKKRSYDTSLMREMSDAHLSIYLTGAVAAYASKTGCPQTRHAAAAMTAATAIFGSDGSESPSDVLKPAFVEACADPVS